MTSTPAKWTIEEYHSAIESGLPNNRRVELLNGEIVEMSPEGEAHAYFSSEAEEYLRGLLGDRNSSLNFCRKLSLVLVL